MSEIVTVSYVDKTSSDLYTSYKKHYFEKQRTEQRLAEPPTIDDLRLNKLPFEREKKFRDRMGKFIVLSAQQDELAVSDITKEIDADISHSKVFADKYADDLYDLALEQARLDGVDINTDTPIKIGQENPTQQAK